MSDPNDTLIRIMLTSEGTEGIDDLAALIRRMRIVLDDMEAGEYDFGDRINSESEWGGVYGGLEKVPNNFLHPDYKEADQRGLRTALAAAEQRVGELENMMQAVEIYLIGISSGPKASIGSMRNTYTPQISVKTHDDLLESVRAALTGKDG